MIRTLVLRPLCVAVALFGALAPPAERCLGAPAFPGAEGFGANASGGRGGEVFHVNSLLNTQAGTYEGPNGYNRGTLRWCLLTETSTAPRTIVFDVGGQVTLTSQITLENSNMTVAGQTAPGQGLTSAGRPWLLESGNNLVIRYIRNRLGRNGGQDSIGVEGGSNIIFDHVTSTWSNDEALSVAKTGTLVTVQNSLIYEGLNHSGHGYGSLIRPDVDSKVTYHHNLYASNESRNPRPGTYNSKTLDFDFRNNVIYNWGDRAGYSGGSSEGNPEYVNMNFVGNYTIAGPSTSNNLTSAFVTSTNAALTAYQSGNLIDSDRDGLLDGVDTGWGMFEVEAGSLTQRATPHPLAPVPVTTQSAADAYESVLNYAGASWWNRDAHDTRIVNQVRTQTGALINHESDVGGFMAPPSVTRDIATWDGDYDGMPTAWELKHGLNPALSSDRNADFDADGYTNLEEYLNDAGAWPAPRPITWTGGAGRYALNANWDTWQPSRFDVVQVRSGTATVDALGQHAGVLRIAPVAGDAAAVTVTAPWFEVTNAVDVGATGASGTLTVAPGAGLFIAVEAPAGGGLGGAVLLGPNGALMGNGQVAADVTSQGVVAPGSSAGTLTITGDYTQQPTGALAVELASATSYDRLVVSGAATLDGLLSVQLLPGFSPAGGASFNLIDWGSRTGVFASVQLPGLGGGLTWNTSRLYSEGVLSVDGGLPGDFNGDGQVDAADYVVWRDTGRPEQDYAAWRDHFGQQAPGASAAGDTQGAPEPATLLVTLGALAALATRRAR